MGRLKELMMFARFTDRARRVYRYATHAAQEAGHPFVEPEHLVIGLCRESSGYFAAVLEKQDVKLAKLARGMETLLPEPVGTLRGPARQIGFVRV